MLPRPYMKKGSNKSCQCGVEFYCPLWAINRKKYCSKACFYPYKPKGGFIMPQEARLKISLARKGMRMSGATKAKISRFFKGRKLSQAHKDKLGLLGELNPSWRGNKVKYRALHAWVQYRLGKPHNCEHCGRTNLPHRQYHWANISRKYRRELSDWLRLCASCHKAYDSKVKMYEKS